MIRQQDVWYYHGDPRDPKACRQIVTYQRQMGIEVPVCPHHGVVANVWLHLGPKLSFPDKEDLGNPDGIEKMQQPRRSSKAPTGSPVEKDTDARPLKDG